jgi:hypothetical protein
MPFPSSFARPRRQAPRTLRERLECSEGGSTGRRTIWPYRVDISIGAAVRSAPGRGRAEKQALYAGGQERQGGSVGPGRGAGITLNKLREPYGQRHALSHLTGVGGIRARSLALLLQLAEQEIQVLLQKLVPEGRVFARAIEIGLGNW